MRTTRRALSRRDRQVLQFVTHYRIGTADLIAQAVFRGQGGQADATRAVRQLVRRGMLRRVIYAAGRSYVVLTRRGARRIGAADRTPRPLTEDSLPVVLAVAAHCVKNDLERITDCEFRELFPELCRPGLCSSNYYLVNTLAGHHLGMFLVDRGASIRRITGKVRRLITQRQSLPAFNSLISTGRFQITILTGLAEHQALIEQRLASVSFDAVQVEGAVVPELGELLTARR